jgi:hypothetical protein
MKPSSTGDIGAFGLFDSAPFTVDGGFANGGTLDLDTGSGNGGSSLTILGTLQNNKSISTGNSQLDAPTTVTATEFNNTGAINLDSKASGPQATLNLSGTAVTDVNTGTISSNAAGISIGGTDQLVNGSSGSAAGLISAAYTGATLGGNGTLTNYGTIAGSQVGIALEPSISIAGTGVALTNFGLIGGATGVVDDGAFASADTIINHGTIIGTSGAAITLGDGLDRVVNFGTITGADGIAVGFGGGHGVIVVKPGAVFNGALSGFSTGDAIDFANVTATSFGYSSGRLTLLNHGTAVESLSLLVSSNASGLDLVSDGSGGVEIGGGPIGPVVTGVYYSPIALNNPAIGNSATMTQSARIAPVYGDAVVGGAAAPSTVTNAGTIVAASNASVGVDLSAGGFGTIANSATIAGANGIIISSASTTTVANSGTISGTGTAGMAVSLGGGNNRLILAPGSALHGVADGGGGASVVEIAPGSGAATAAAAGIALAVGAAPAGIAYVNLGQVENFSALQVDPTATANATGALYFPTLVNQGQINIASGDSVTLGTVASVSNAGAIDLRTGGIVEFKGAVADQTIVFRPPGGGAVIDRPNELSATVFDDFTSIGLDTIDLAGLPFAGNASVPFNSATDTLNVSEGSASATLQLDAEDYSGIAWSAGSDGANGTRITVTGATETTPPTLVNDTGLGLTAGTTATIGEGELEFNDAVSSAAQLIYTVTTTPADGTFVGKRRGDHEWQHLHAIRYQ